MINKMLALPVLLLLLGVVPAAVLAGDLEVPSTEDFQQFPSVGSRDSVQAFRLIGSDPFSAPAGVDAGGFVNIFKDNDKDRHTQIFVLRGNNLHLDYGKAICYVDPMFGSLECAEDPHNYVPKKNRQFSLAENGTLIYDGTSLWWACLTQQSGMYSIFNSSNKLSQHCEKFQLLTTWFPLTKKNPLGPSTGMMLADISSRPEKTCVFNMRIQAGPEYDPVNRKLEQTTFYWLGKRLGTGPSGNQYCYINVHTRKLDCADKSSQDLMENFHTIDFSINDRGYLLHNGSEKWVWCKTSKGWEGPYDEKKVSDSDCQATQVPVMVGTVPGHDCRSRLAKPASRALDKRGETTNPDPDPENGYILPLRCLFTWWTKGIDDFVDHDTHQVGVVDHNTHDARYELQGNTLFRKYNHLRECFVNDTTSQLSCKNFGETVDPSPKFSIDAKTHHLLHDGKKIWYECRRNRTKLSFLEKPPSGWINFADLNKDTQPTPDQIICVVGPVRVFDLNCPKNKTSAIAPSSSSAALNPRGVDVGSLKPTPLPPFAPNCPSNLVDTLFKSPMMVIPISSKDKSKSFSIVKDITVTPTQSVLFKFFIPWTKPYYQKICALLLLLPEIKYLEIKHQSTPPALEISMLEGSMDEKTTWNTMPKFTVLVTKVLPNEIKPGQDNFIATFPCDSNTFKSFMISSKGGLSLSVKQNGVPNESGLHLVPCA